MNGNEMINILYEYEGWLTSPIVTDNMAFPFLTMGHVDFCEAMGFPSYQSTRVLRQVVPDALRDEEQLDEIIARHAFDYSYFDRELSCLKNLLAGPGVRRGGGVFGPLTIASDILGAERTLKLTVKNPEFVLKLVGYVTEFIIELAQLEEANGAEFFWIAEPFPSVLSPKLFTKFSGQFLKRIYDSIDVPGWLHVCGPTLKHTRYIEETGAQVISIDSVTDIGKCIRMVKGNTIIMGNINPATLLLEEDDRVNAEIQEVLEACKPYKNFIMSTGCAFMQGTDPERLQRLFAHTEAFACHSNEEFRQIRDVLDLMLHVGTDDLGAPPIREYLERHPVSEQIIGIVREEYPKVLAARKAGGYA